LEKEILRCFKRSRKKHYQGKETRLSKRIQLLSDKKDYHDYLRWIILPKACLKGLSTDELRFLQEGG
jgi:hypothetical protein